ncbi:MAG: hypothetical protein ACFB0E_10875 [Leptolyngbyaceae cyanobacterium]
MTTAVDRVAGQSAIAELATASRRYCIWATAGVNCSSDRGIF